jgi:hypothetical protein
MNMKQFYSALITSILLTACAGSKLSKQEIYPAYTPDSRELYDEIVALDSIFFNAYNGCNLELIDTLISNDIEFYHDLGGLSTSKQQIIDGLNNNICGKVSRVLQKGSIEVYPIHNYGAVEMGKHGFYNHTEKNKTIHYSKFVHIWQKNNGQWKLTRVVSLH